MSKRLIQYHLKPGTLVLIAGNLSGVIVARIDAVYYDVLVEGSVFRVHRDDMIENDE
jgi:hypothetical protein